MSEAIDTEAIAQFKRPGSEQDEVKGCDSISVFSAYRRNQSRVEPAFC